MIWLWVELMVKTVEHPSAPPTNFTEIVKLPESRDIASFSAMSRLCFCGFEINKKDELRDFTEIRG